MALCACNCGKTLKGKATRFYNDDHRNAFYTEARRRGAALALGKFLAGLLPKKGNGKLHCGHPGRSKRLAKTLNALMDLKVCTTLQLHERTGGMKVSTDVDDLRRAGYPISPARYLRTTDEGRRIFEYEWLG